eukprot:scaffold27166_cov87-Cyclotella_meneghiniana.AAC.1
MDEQQHQHPVCHLRATNHNNSTHHLPRSQFNSGRFVIPYCRDIIHMTLTIPRPVRLTLQDRQDIDIFSQIPSPAHHAHHHLRPRQHQQHQQPTTKTPSNRRTNHHRTVNRLSPFKFTLSTSRENFFRNNKSSLEVLRLTSTSQGYDISSRQGTNYVTFFLSTAPTSSLQWRFMQTVTHPCRCAVEFRRSHPLRPPPKPDKWNHTNPVRQADRHENHRIRLFCRRPDTCLEPLGLFCPKPRCAVPILYSASELMCRMQEHECITTIQHTETSLVNNTKLKLSQEFAYKPSSTKHRTDVFKILLLSCIGCTSMKEESPKSTTEPMLSCGFIRVTLPNAVPEGVVYSSGNNLSAHWPKASTATVIS